MTEEIIKNLGPLTPLVGVWEGAEGEDTAPSNDRGTEIKKFRERITFEPLGPVRNHEQVLYGLRYSTTAWPLGKEDFLEAGKKRLMGDTAREANSGEVTDIKKENEHLKQLVAEIALKNRVLKKSLNGTDCEDIGL